MFYSQDPVELFAIGVASFDFERHHANDERLTDEEERVWRNEAIEMMAISFGLDTDAIQDGLARAKEHFAAKCDLVRTPADLLKYKATLFNRAR
jgi:uncharacterized membrane protein